MVPINNWTFIIAAYAVTWLAVGGYWFFVHRSVREARARYERAQAELLRAGGAS